MTAATALSDARRYADLLGIGEDEPLAFLKESHLSKLIDSLNFSLGMSPRARAEFCARYLPTLVRCLKHPDLPTFGPFTTAATQALVSMEEQPLWTGHFLRACSEAEDLLITIIFYFVHIPTEFPNDFQSLLMVIASCQVIETIILSVLVHGKNSTASLILQPKAGSSFLSACRAFLSSPLLTTPKANDDTLNATVSLFRYYLEKLPMILGVDGVGEVVVTRRVLANATSEETLRCELSTVDEESWDDEETDECVKVAGKNRKLKFCSICKSVAYCSLEHQRADWKEHKKVCVAPSW